MHKIATLVIALTFTSISSSGNLPVTAEDIQRTSNPDIRSILLATYNRQEEIKKQRTAQTQQSKQLKKIVAKRAK